MEVGLRAGVRPDRPCAAVRDRLARSLLAEAGWRDRCWPRPATYAIY